MLTAVWETFVDLWQDLMPWVIIDAFEGGVMLRAGKYHKRLAPGIHFKMPYFDEAITISTVYTTHDLPAQSLVTSDDINIAVAGIIRYKISDVKLFLLTIYEATDVLKDVSMGIIKRHIIEYSWDECRTSDIEAVICEELQEEVSKFGVDIPDGGFTITDLAKTRNIRLLHDHAYRGASDD